MLVSSLYSTIAVLASIVLIGLWMVRKIRFDDQVKRLMSFIIVNVAMPCIILNSLIRIDMDTRMLANIGLTLLLSLLLNVIGIALGWLANRRRGITERRRRELAVLSGLGNTASLGIPLCAALFGPEAVVLAAVFDAGVDITIWTLAVVLLQEKPSFQLRQLRTLLNPPMLAIAAGMAISFTAFPLPAFAESLTATLSQAVVPLSMLYIGMLMGSTFHRDKLVPYLAAFWRTLSIKMVVLPCAAIGLLLLLPIPAPVAQVTLVQSAMPTFTLASIIVSLYSGDEESAVMTVVWSTVASMMTVPAMILLGIRWIG